MSVARNRLQAPIWHSGGGKEDRKPGVLGRAEKLMPKNAMAPTREGIERNLGEKVKIGPLR
jgi:hypothetical protein